MRPFCLFLLIAITGNIQSEGQNLTQPQPPQTARQALLEMFMGTPEMFQKHLLDVTRKALIRDDSASSPIVRQFAAFRAQMAVDRNLIETFETGTTLLVMNEDNGQHKLEIDLEHDDPMSDLDELEVSFHSYKEGMPEPLPVVPRLTLSMKQEKEVWKLNEIMLALRVPLGDSEYLHGLQKSQAEASESSAVAVLRTLNTAEISYAASFSEKGFTCKLAELGGSSMDGEPTPQRATLIDDVLASGRRGGYVFSISGCDVSPVSKYQTTAVPADKELGARAFCSDESGVIRYATDGKATTCLSQGVPLQ
jgi:hypothetical protein